jgi:NADH-quinone oxidoreductase subunit G
VSPADAPAALVSRYWAPGWNSTSGLHKLQEEVNGPLRGGPVGVRLLDGAAAVGGPAAHVPVPPAFERRGEWLLVPVHHIFGSDDLSMFTPGIAERAPRPYIGLNPDDAAELSLRAGDDVALWLPWLDHQLSWRPMPSLPAGVAGLPVGVPGVPFVALPARCRLTRAEAEGTS